LADLCADWKKHGSAVITKVRQSNPSGYLRVVASIIPRDQPTPLQSEFDHLTEVELLESLSEEVRCFLRREGLNVGPLKDL
jgi:hypothetical protein